MNKVTKLGRRIGMYEADEKTVSWKHHGREQGKTVGQSNH